MEKRKITFTLVILALLGSLRVSGQALKVPRVSPPTKLHQTIGLTDIVVNYSRPQVITSRGDRTDQIYGNAIWYGYRKINFGSQNEIPWRAGANENTTMEFSNDVKIEGKELKAGKYGFHVAVHENNKATLIFSSDYSSWGSFNYDEKNDVLRLDITTKEVPFTNVLTYDFVDLKNDRGTLALTWEKKSFPFEIVVDVKEDVVKSFRAQLDAGELSANDKLQAARYCVQNNYNLEEASRWIDEALKENKSYNGYVLKAMVHMNKGETEAALKITDEAAAIADINQLNALAYQLLQNKMTDKAVEYFELNVKRNPKDANVHDSLGEGYMARGDNKKAIKSFKKSLSLNPQDNVKDNSIANLKKLGVNYQ